MRRRFEYNPRMRFRIVAVVWAALAAGCGNSENRVVVYCAQDREFAEDLFRDFARQSAIAVAPKFDTEATKSVSLASELRLEARRPRCDVHWNNEVIGTIRLAREGVYEPYVSPSAESYPEWAKAPDRTWTAFAARARVIVVNPKLVPEADRPRSLLDLADPKWKGRVAMAKPLFGTTATQAACLFDVLGTEAATRYYRALMANDVQIVAGNKHVAEGVARGDFAVGVTDTDDAIGEIEAGRELVLIFPDAAGHLDHPRLGTLFIPNTVAVIRKAPNGPAARKLVDYLLSAESESRLAEGPSRQLPLNPRAPAKLPDALRAAAAARPMGVHWSAAADRWAESQRLMADLFGK